MSRCRAYESTPPGFAVHRVLSAGDPDAIACVCCAPISWPLTVCVLRCCRQVAEEREKAEFEEMAVVRRAQAAVTIQAWWRGHRVRTALKGGGKKGAKKGGKKGKKK